MDATPAFVTPTILDHTGRPLRTPATDNCPQCGADTDKRGPSGGFGTPWTVCSCGFQWKDRVWRG